MLLGSALRENLGNDEIECVMFFLKVDDGICFCAVCVRFVLAVVAPCIAANYMICLLIGGRLLFLLSVVVTAALRSRPLKFLVVWLC